VNNFSMDAWVTFKLFGLMGLNLLYVFIMMAYLVGIGALKEDDSLADGNTESAKEQQP